MSCRHAGLQRGAVLVTGLILLAMLAILLASVFRTSALSVAQAASLRSADRVFQACEDALREALSATEFVRAQRMTTTRSFGFDTEVTTTVRYIGELGLIAHAAYRQDQHAQLRAHYFVATATATGRRAVERTHEQVFYVIADAATPPNVALARDAATGTQPFGGGVVAVSWRALAQ